MPSATIALPAIDIERANAFYRELLGLSRSDQRTLPVVFQRRPGQESGAAPSCHPARLRLGRLSCLERALKVTWERGGRIVNCAQRTGRGIWSATIVDSEGNLVSLYARG